MKNDIFDFVCHEQFIFVLKSFFNRGASRKAIAEIIPADLIRIMPAKGG